MKADDEEGDELEQATEDALPADWPHWPLVRGRRAVLYGGDRREERRVALERALQLSTLEWVEGGRTREIESLAERVRNGSVDLLFITKFTAHKGTDPLVAAAKAAGKAYFVLRQGYGLAAIRSVIERVAGTTPARADMAGGSAARP